MEALSNEAADHAEKALNKLEEFHRKQKSLEWERRKKSFLHVLKNSAQEAK